MRHLAIPVVAAFVLGSVVATTAASRSAERGPAWRLDLRPSGYSDEDFTAPDAITAAAQIAFGSAEELIVLRDTGPFKKPVQVQAFVIDTLKGQLTGKKEWTRESGSARIYSTADGKYLSSGTVLDSGLQETKERLSGTVEMVSPDGRYFTIWDAIPGHAVTRFFDARSLSPTGAEFVNKVVDAIAADRITYVVELVDEDRTAAVVESTATETYPLKTTCEEIRPRFVSDEILVVFGCHRMNVLSVGGTALFSAEVGRENRWLALASRDGSRFAIQSARYGFGEFPKLQSETIRVFDVNERREIYRTTVSDWHGRHGESGVALSPDGLGLAINTVGIVQYFRLPPKAPPSPPPPAKTGS